MPHDHKYIIADDQAMQVLLDKMSAGGTRQKRHEKLLKALDEASRRPERQQLFKAFAAEAEGIQKDRLAVLELGCGPGFLAEQLLQNCNISRYTLVDFSPHMLELSREHLAGFKDRTVFFQRDFKTKSWTAAIPADFDLLVAGRARAPPCEPHPKTVRSAL